MIGTRKCGVAAMGTARGRTGWPPKEIGKRSIQDVRYNSLYYMNDKVGNYRIFRWIDNNIVKLVSNVHTGTSSDKNVLRNRRKPRVNEFNYKHIRLIWGNDHRKEITIPQIVNDYNHWMLGVDMVDQLISYYRPKIRCKRTWMPIFLHCLDILRVNSYVLYKETAKDHPDVADKNICNHKQFLIEYINSLIRRGNAETKCTTITTRPRTTTHQDDQNDLRIVHKGKKGRIVMKRSCPSLAEYDNVRRSRPGEHELIKSTTQSTCRYCQYLVLLAKAKNFEPKGVKRPRSICNVCSVHLCKEHFDAFHFN